MYDEPGAVDELGVVWRTEIEDQGHGEVNDAPNDEGGAARGAARNRTYEPGTSSAASAVWRNSLANPTCETPAVGGRPLYAVADESAYHIIPGAQCAAGVAAYLVPTSQAAAPAVYHSANTGQLDAALYDNPLAESTRASYYSVAHSGSSGAQDDAYSTVTDAAPAIRPAAVYHSDTRGGRLVNAETVYASASAACSAAPAAELDAPAGEPTYDSAGTAI